MKEISKCCSQSPPTLAFFGDSCANTAMTRHVWSLGGAGVNVVGFMVRRDVNSYETHADWQNEGPRLWHG